MIFILLSVKPIGFHKMVIFPDFSIIKTILGRHRHREKAEKQKGNTMTTIIKWVFLCIKNAFNDGHFEKFIHFV